MFGHAPLPRLFWILWTGSLINRLGGFVLPLMALYLTTERHVPVEQVGFVIGLWGGGALLGGTLGGYLADLIGRRRTLILVLVAGALSMIHLSLARHPAHIAFAALLLGLTGETYRPAMQAAVADMVPAEGRSHAYGMLYWAGNIGFAFGSAVGGAMAQHGWYLLFWCDAATTLVFALVVFLRIPETRPAHLVHQRRPPLLAPLTDRPFVVFVALVTMVGLLFHQAFTTLPIDLNRHGLSPRSYGFLIALNGVLIMLLQPGASRVLSRFARHRVLAAAAGLVGLGFAATGTVHSVAGYVASITVWSLGEIAMAGLAPAAVADVAPPSQRGAYQGLMQMGMGAAALLAPVLGSLVLGRFGSVALWSCCGVAGLAAAVGQLALGPLRAHGNPAGAAGIDPA
ncbi:MAG TPA: MFS transporter [Myxococcales bacterium]|nr:MFS transporter [Myxococcales bacterium]